MSKSVRICLSTIVVLVSISSVAYCADVKKDTSGQHYFHQDDKNQFVDVYVHQDDRVTIKVSNGRPLRPMWINLHAVYRQGTSVITHVDYHVYCKSPVGHGAENWFEFHTPGANQASTVELSSNKEKPWKSPSDGWTVGISTDGTF
ncbi:MAG: hypothetical protein QM636_14580 [Rhizobium sp.]